MSHDAPSSSPSLLKKVLFWCVLLVLPLFALELSTRLYFAHQLGSSLLFYGTDLNRERGDDSHSGYMNLLDGYFKYHPHEKRFTRDKETGRLIPVGINSRGFRGREFSTAKAPGVTRIVTLGASSTFGFSDRDDETYPYYLEQFLNRDAHGKRFEVINMGIPHLKSNQIVALFEQEVLPLRPDIVTFYEGINDSWGSTVIFSKQYGEPTAVRQQLRKNPFLHRGFQWVRDHVMVVGVADAYMKRVRDVRYTKDDLIRHMVGKRENFVANVATIANECRRRGIIFIPAT
ncbi:MAG TPA: hypothetical protein VFH88_09155, partial [Candidatus Krumholzibacteria bacterium]|nr:hypothetical protein [Candidatus Krumholzibacteria bacterium]